MLPEEIQKKNESQHKLKSQIKGINQTWNGLEERGKGLVWLKNVFMSVRCDTILVCNKLSMSLSIRPPHPNSEIGNYL